jgi:ubiquinone biosynthesis protein UbiJ
MEEEGCFRSRKRVPSMEKLIYSNSEQLHEIVEELFLRLNKIEEVKRKTLKIKSRFKFEIKDFSFSFILEIWEGEVKALFADSQEVSATLKMNAKVFDEAMSGTLNLPIALVNKSLTIEGDTRSVMNLVSLGKFLNSTYKEVLSEFTAK